MSGSAKVVFSTVKTEAKLKLMRCSDAILPLYSLLFFAHFFAYTETNARVLEHKHKHKRAYTDTWKRSEHTHWRLCISEWNETVAERYIYIYVLSMAQLSWSRARKILMRDALKNGCWHLRPYITCIWIGFVTRRSISHTLLRHNLSLDLSHSDPGQDIFRKSMRFLCFGHFFVLSA